MSFQVYILRSCTRGRTYVGQTEDVGARLALHNSGSVKSTKPFRPWEVIYLVEFGSRSEAMRREKWFKSSAGRKRIVELLRGKEGGGLSVSSR